MAKKKAGASFNFGANAKPRARPKGKPTAAQKAQAIAYLKGK